MAILHRATVTPGKLELLNGWLPSQLWFRTSALPALERVTAFRFDDPAGAVGVEVLLVRDGDGPLWQVPLTYRDAALAGAESHLIGTAEHSVLGTRWVYDAAADPVFAAALAHAVLTGAGQADEVFEEASGPVVRPPICVARGTGTAVTAPVRTGLPTVADGGDPTVITTGGVTLTVARVVDVSGAVPGWAGDAARLVATWDGVTTPVTLAAARVAG